MKITSKEHITLDGYTPIRVIELYNKGRHFHTYATTDITRGLREIKQDQRHERKRATPNARLFVVDENGNTYRFTYCLTFSSIAEEYRAMKELKAYIEKQNTNAIQVQTENGIERECTHTYTIKHAKAL